MDMKNLNDLLHGTNTEMPWLTTAQTEFIREQGFERSDSLARWEYDTEKEGEDVLILIYNKGVISLHCSKSYSNESLTLDKGYSFTRNSFMEEYVKMTKDLSSHFNLED